MDRSKCAHTNTSSFIICKTIFHSIPFQSNLVYLYILKYNKMFKVHVKQVDLYLYTKIINNCPLDNIFRYCYIN